MTFTKQRQHLLVAHEVVEDDGCGQDNCDHGYRQEDESPAQGVHLLQQVAARQKVRTWKSSSVYLHLKLWVSDVPPGGAKRAAQGAEHSRVSNAHNHKPLYFRKLSACQMHIQKHSPRKFMRSNPVTHSLMDVTKSLSMDTLWTRGSR